jgi:hypothetical protein
MTNKKSACIDKGEVHLDHDEMIFAIGNHIVSIETEIDGDRILDIGGGGEGVIGLCYGKKVISIDLEMRTGYGVSRKDKEKNELREALKMWFPLILIISLFIYVNIKCFNSSDRKHHK